MQPLDCKICLCSDCASNLWENIDCFHCDDCIDGIADKKVECDNFK